MLIGEYKIEEHSVECLCFSGVSRGRCNWINDAVEVIEAFPRDKRRDTCSDQNIVAEPGAVFEAEAEVSSDTSIDIVLEGESFENSGLVKPEEIGIGNRAEFRCDFKVHPGIQQPDTRIYKVALPLKLAAAEVCEEAFSLCEVDAEELDLLTLPKAELSAGEIWIVENGVKTFGVLIIGVVIAGGPKTGGAEPNPVAIHREFDSPHVGTNISSLSLDWIQTIAASDVIKGMTDVDFSNMAVASHAEVISVDLVLAKDADGIRPNEKLIAVELDARLVVVVVKAELRSVTRKDEILTKVVEDDSILVAVIEGIQHAVRLFFSLIEPNEIELIPIGQTCAEETNGAIGVCEDKPAKVAHKRLRAGSDGEKIVIGTEIREFCFDKPFFDAASCFRRVVPSRTFGLTTASSLTSR